MRVQPGAMQAGRRRGAMQRRHRGSYRAIWLSPRQGQALRAKFRHVFVFPARGAGSAGDCEPVLSPFFDCSGVPIFNPQLLTV